ncbi:MAG TPA: PQQ-dependent sugar dehydrogenase, partial [Candidatus Limnocylindrales bacterium]|nr:PQQ-dependent sugar dehydrogenase [Candidatus Limnocylindrales bacterium]
GDGGSGGDPMGNGQNPDALLGKILRIDVDGKTGDKAYGIPAENPYAKGAGAPEVWISGMRNPWRTSFDRKNGDFWIGDVGQGLYEEVDVVRVGATGPLNFGWNITEGFHCYEATTCDQAGLGAPVAEYGHDAGCAVVGGYVYRGSAFPLLDGTYLFSDNCSSTIWAIDSLSNGPSVPTRVGQVEGNISTFGEDASGELYALTLDGDVLKVSAAAP